MFSASASWALDGSNDVIFTVPSGQTTGWKTFEIITGDDALGGLAVGGFTWDVDNHDDWDGLGAYRQSESVLSVFINHEVGMDVANDIIGSFSRVDLDVTALKDWIALGIPNNSNFNQVPPPSTVVMSIGLGWSSVDSASVTTALDNPCSANAWLANTFGEGRGFADDLYLLGEELEGGGSIWVMDLSDNKLYQAVDLGAGRWENATPIDTGRTDTIALVISEDRGPFPNGREPNDAESSPIYLYVGEKDPTGNFLERNGLSGGKIYYWDCTDLEGRYGTFAGIFNGGNGLTLNGQWVSDLADAVQFSKCEDVHTNMNKDSEGYGLEVALACQWQGLFKIDFKSTPFVQGDIGPGAMSTISVLLKGEEGDSVLGDQDNLTWSADGKIYINEDEPTDGNVWVLDPEGIEAGYATGNSTPDATQYGILMDVNTDGESSGIIDVSEELDYQPGSLFLTVAQSGTLNGNQLALLVSPNAAPLSSVYDDWAASYPALDTEAKRLDTADPDMDGLLNAVEFALGLSPVGANTTSPLTFDLNASTLSFIPVRSLNVVEYWVDCTEDFSLGFTASILVTAEDISATGVASVSLPQGDRLFYRLRVEVP